jgi:hypothetical protein
MGAEIAVGGAEYGAKPRELDLVSMWQRIEGGNNAQPQPLVMPSSGEYSSVTKYFPRQGGQT